MDISEKQIQATASINLFRDASNTPDKPQMGTVHFGGNACDSLEPAYVTPVHEGHPAIPKGTYPVKMLYSEDFGRMLPHVLDVLGRDAIMMHPGNTAADTKGCICVGAKCGDGLLGTSREWSDRLNTWIDGLGDAPCQLVIL